MNLARLSKALDLTDAQIEQYKTIDAEAKQQMANKKELSKAHRESTNAIIQSSNFDEKAWLLARSGALDDRKLTLVMNIEH